MGRINFPLVFTGITIFFTTLLNELQGRPPTDLLHEYVNATNLLIKEFDRILSVEKNATMENLRILTNGNREPTVYRLIVEEPSQDIVFPDSLEMHEHLALDLTSTRLETKPECAKDVTFCEEVPSYPHKLVRDILGKLKVRDDFFTPIEENPDEIAERIGEPDEKFICQSIDKTIFPKVGKTKSHKWKYIINDHKNGHVQAIKAEMCSRIGEPCDLLGREVNGFITSCKQKYTYRRLLSLSESGELIQDTFKMPSACCCSYKRDFGFLARFGSAGTTPVR